MPFIKKGFSDAQNILARTKVGARRKLERVFINEGEGSPIKEACRAED